VLRSRWPHGFAGLLDVVHPCAMQTISRISS
jgi:hypothetical protein